MGIAVLNQLGLPIEGFFDGLGSSSSDAVVGAGSRSDLPLLVVFPAVSAALSAAVPVVEAGASAQDSQLTLQSVVTFHIHIPVVSWADFPPRSGSSV